MVLHTVCRLAHVSAIVAAAIATSLCATAHAADTGTTENTSLAYDVTGLMGSGSLRFSDTLIHALQTSPTVTFAPIVVSGDGTGMVAAPVTSLSDTFDTPSTSPQVIERLSMDLSTGTLFGYLASGAAVSLVPTNLSLSPVPAPSASTPPSITVPAFDFSLFPQNHTFLDELPQAPLFVWQTANGMMQSTILLDVSPIPEASSVALMALGLVGMGLLNLRRNR